ncbi:MAG: alpha/beta fold hydrolase [Leptospiraceae bacterium]|nr:alpha/beta fold hydrolase [Leptospiraceae bacterium]MCP5510967.1 alpha/beta fold hydrolase [Leptospiraceae bacterium]
MIETLLIFGIVLIVFGIYYFNYVAHYPVVHHAKNKYHKKLVSRCKILSEKYYPTFWCFNNHLMLIVLLLNEFRSKVYAYDSIDRLEMSDGGLTGLAWSATGTAYRTKGTPIVIIFHTISGDEQDVKTIVRYIKEELGWIAVVCIRRGHGNIPLRTPKINTMGSTSDLREQLDFISRKFPSSLLFGVGLSAGSGLIAQYLGEEGLKSRFVAAVAVSPAYDIEKAFHRVHPFYNKMMGQRLINFFLKRHYESLSGVKGFMESMNSNNIGEFQDRIHSFAGFDSKEEYYRLSNPINVIHNIKTPLLVLNSEDDPICVDENVQENLHWVDKLPHSTLIHTKRGSHIAFFEGIRARSWSDRVIGEYFKTILSTRKNFRKKKP